ncbi:MAG: hypothetical protein V1492_04820 [Candidatus Micrarchaeota archaeon]
MDRKKVLKATEIILALGVVILLFLYLVYPYLISLLVGSPLIGACHYDKEESLIFGTAKQTATNSTDPTDLVLRMKSLCSTGATLVGDLLLLDAIILIIVFAADKILDWKKPAEKTAKKGSKTRK